MFLPHIVYGLLCLVTHLPYLTPAPQSTPQTLTVSYKLTCVCHCYSAIVTQHFSSQYHISVAFCLLHRFHVSVPLDKCFNSNPSAGDVIMNPGPVSAKN